MATYNLSFPLPHSTNYSPEDENDDVLRAHSVYRVKNTKEELDIPEFKGHDCSYESLDKVAPKHFSTKWGPVGFSKSNHPLSIMVSTVLFM